jgi:hypothetical protein
MTESYFDKPVFRRLALALEHDHNALLGTRNTMRLARVFNRIKNRRFHRHRKHLYEHHLPELFEENGRAQRPTLRLSDGWAIDNTHALPYLERLLADADEIIRERGGVARRRGERAFFQQIITDEHIAHYPSVLDFATSTEVLQTVMDHLRVIPALSVSRPLGVRLNESAQHYAGPSHGIWRESQQFHCDYHDAPMVYVIVALRDVTLSHGPFCFLPASASRRVSNALGYGRRGRSHRVADEDLYAAAKREDLIEFVCPAGTVLFLDSSTCFHFGSRDAEIPRHLMMYAYVSVCRRDFGDLLRKESTVPVLDPDTDTCRMKYPIRVGDSRLHRLVVDRHYVDDTCCRRSAPIHQARSSYRLAGSQGRRARARAGVPSRF